MTLVYEGNPRPKKKWENEAQHDFCLHRKKTLQKGMQRFQNFLKFFKNLFIKKVRNISMIPPHTYQNGILKLFCKLLSLGYGGMWLLQTLNKHTAKSVS